MAKQKRNKWPFHGTPAIVKINGREYILQTSAIPYRCVVAQYRERVPMHSGHLYLYSNGTYEINHIDSFNPNFGLTVQHALTDVIGSLPSIVRGLTGSHCQPRKDKEQ